MDGSAPGNEDIKSKVDDSFLKDIFNQIDKKIYKELLIFLTISLLLAAGFYIFLRIGQNQYVDSKNQNNTQKTTDNSKYEEIKRNASIDQKRKVDISTINSALKAYYLDKQTAPELLKDIVPGSLPELPTDPVTKKDYQYVPSEDKKSWVLTTTLTSGETFEVAGPNLN